MHHSIQYISGAKCSEWQKSRLSNKFYPVVLPQQKYSKTITTVNCYTIISFLLKLQNHT